MRRDRVRAPERGAPERGAPERAPERGAAAVEFALVVPIVFGIMAMLFTIAMVLYNQSALERTAEVAARAVALPLDPYARPVEYRTQDQVVEVVRATSPVPITSLSIADGTGAPVTDTTALRSGDSFTVTVIYDYNNPIFRMLRAFVSGDEGRKYRLEAESAGTRE